MVAAVFHEIDVAEKGSTATHSVATQSEKTAVAAPKVMSGAPTQATPTAVKVPRDLSFLWLGIMPPVLGFGLLIVLWMAISITTKGSIPSPADTFSQAVILFSDPFYSKGPNDQGIGWNVLSSLKRVAMGFGLAAIVGIPVGFMIGRFKFLSSMFNPLISLMRPVSPLAWLPIGLLVFKGANPAAIWTIFICSIWPMIINTAVGCFQPSCLTC